MERPKITSVRLICEPSTYFANTCPNHVNHWQSWASFNKVGKYFITNCLETFISRFFWATRLALASIFLLLSLFFLFGPETILRKGSSSQQIHVAEIWNPAREKSLANEDEDGKAPVVTICPQNKVSRSQFLSALASPSLPWKGLRIFLIKMLGLSLLGKICTITAVYKLPVFLSRTCSQPPWQPSLHPSLPSLHYDGHQTSGSVY